MRNKKKLIGLVDAGNLLKIPGVDLDLGMYPRALLKGGILKQQDYNFRLLQTESPGTVDDQTS